jgi:hypothetical protein
MTDLWLSNSKLGARIGMSPSGASYLRNGQRMPSPRVLRALVEQFGVPYETLNDAIIEANRGDAQSWVALMESLVGVAPSHSDDSPTLRVACPYCRAPRDRRCVTGSGKVLAFGHEHAARRDAACPVAQSA